MELPWWAMAGLLGAAGAGAWGLYALLRPVDEALAGLMAVALALKLERRGDLAQGRANGVDLAVRVRRGVVPGSHRGHELIVTLGDVGLTLRAEQLTDRLRGPDPKTGDPVFDRRVRVEGRSSAMGRLSAVARAAWLALDERAASVEVADGRLVVVALDDEPNLCDLARDVVGLGVELVRPGDELRGLVWIARKDPAEGVRLRALARLADLDREAARAVAKRHLREGTPATRVLAAAVLERVDELLGQVADESLPTAPRVAAAQVIARLGDEQHLPELAALASLRSDEVRAAVVVAAGAIRARGGGGAWEGALSLADLVSGELGVPDEGPPQG